MLITFLFRSLLFVTRLSLSPVGFCLSFFFFFIRLEIAGCVQSSLSSQKRVFSFYWNGFNWVCSSPPHSGLLTIFLFLFLSLPCIPFLLALLPIHFALCVCFFLITEFLCSFTFNCNQIDFVKSTTFNQVLVVHTCRARKDEEDHPLVYSEPIHCVCLPNCLVVFVFTMNSINKVIS